MAERRGQTDRWKKGEMEEDARTDGRGSEWRAELITVRSEGDSPGSSPSLHLSIHICLSAPLEYLTCNWTKGTPRYGGPLRTQVWGACGGPKDTRVKRRGSSGQWSHVTGPGSTLNFWVDSHKGLGERVREDAEENCLFVSNILIGGRGGELVI